MIWTITIPVEPTGQMRARAFVRGGHAAMHKDKKQQSRENAIMAHVAQHMPPATLTGALELRVTAYLPLPKSKPKKWLALALAGLVRPTSKPDLDNLVKQVKDCLTQMQVWEDDKLVVDCHSAKHYSDCPRWEIEVRTWAPQVEGINVTPAQAELLARCT